MSHDASIYNATLEMRATLFYGEKLLNFGDFVRLRTTYIIACRILIELVLKPF